MAIGWVSLLKTVPWTEVISNAPAIADGARKLWKKVSGSPVAGEGEAAASPLDVPPDTDAVARLEAEVMALRKSHAELQAEMLASSELIKALADQNAELVKRIEAHRVRLRVLSGALAVLTLVMGLGLARALSLW